MGNKDKNKDQGDSATATEGASGDSITSPWDALHANRDLSWEREARDDKLEEDKKEGKYSSEKIESYFTLFELLLAPKSSPLLAVEELRFAKQGSIDSGEFHAHVKIAKRCKFPCTKAEERAIRDNFLRHEQYMGQGQSHKFDE